MHPSEGAALDELDVVDDEESVGPGDLLEETRGTADNWAGGPSIS
jgi:hypothetical protein